MALQAASVRQSWFAYLGDFADVAMLAVLALAGALLLISGLLPAVFGGLLLLVVGLAPLIVIVLAILAIQDWDSTVHSR